MNTKEKSEAKLRKTLAVIQENHPKAQVHQEKNGTIFIVIPDEKPTKTGKWAMIVERLHQENLLDGEKYQEAQALFREFRENLSH